MLAFKPPTVKRSFPPLLCSESRRTDRDPFRRNAGCRSGWRRGIAACALVGVSFAARAATVSSGGPVVERHVRLTMRDGVHLDTNIFHCAAAGRAPALLFRTPYGKGA